MTSLRNNLTEMAQQAEDGAYDNPLANIEDEKVEKTPATPPPPYSAVAEVYDAPIGQPEFHVQTTQPGYPHMGISAINAQSNQAVDVMPGGLGGPATIITMQAPPKPPNYKVLSVFSFCCCNWCFGIAAMHHAWQSDHFYGQGQYLEAQRSSEKARHFSILAMIIGFVLGIIWVTFTILRTAALNHR